MFMKCAPPNDTGLFSTLALAAFVVGHFIMSASPCHAADLWSVDMRGDSGQMQIKLRGKPFATYSFRDPAISRPYFANVFAPSGEKITRNHPLAADDPQDHDKIHPGMWLAFGDLSGADNWRLAAPVEHVDFIGKPQADEGTLKFAVENRYLTADKQEICREICRYTFRELPQGVLMLWDSTFRSEDGSFVFGDQEEMGLGVRLNPAVAVKGGNGRILNSNGQKNEKEVWAQPADWCDYSGMVGDKFVGITIMPDPENFRKAWCHARDTGFMAMNPFGHNAFTGGEKSAIEVSAGEDFRLRYGVLFHWNDRASDFEPQPAYKRYLELVSDSK